MMHKISLIFVPGAWHTPDCWGKVVSAMEAQDYKCIPITLPTTQSTSKSVNFSTDVNAVREALISETTQGRDVVILVHSYGGAVGASAIKGLSRKTAEAGDDKGHVIGLFMIGTGFVAPGMSFLDGIGGKPPPTWDADYENNTMPIKVDPINMLYHDLPEEEGKYWAGKLTNQALTSVTDGYEVSYEGWKDVPVWYIVTAEDRALPVEVQRMFAQSAEKAGADLTLQEIASSHSPMLSKSKEIVKFLEDAVVAFTRS
ncbi:alpha beta-hydrolase [Fusarium longipes]|uniref:Alpha beta-hydrolase n=1 Tax=Fusarium longipes TaxID=694270 RepID=A0A395SXM0_9HYPO|nr:alpha beta-hydrolase [Fusarium longipes]